MIPNQTDKLRHFIDVALEQRPTVANALLWGVTMTLLATFVRWGLNPIFGGEYPYVTYFLGAALAGGLGGVRGGVIAVLGSVLCAWFFFLPPQGSFALLETHAWVSLLVFAANVSVGALAAAMLRTALWQLSISERRQTLLVQELNHRVKNNLATIQAIARQTARGVERTADFIPTFEGRVIALGRTHELLAETSWTAVEVKAIVAAELQPYEGRSVVMIEGPSILLGPTPAVSLGMIVHELATNSAKYGAIKNGGQVQVSWSATSGEGELAWTERSAAAVKPPERQGFGTRLIQRLAEGDLKGRADLVFKAEGLTATIRFHRPG